MLEKLVNLQSHIKERLNTTREVILNAPTYAKKLWEDASEPHYGYSLVDNVFEGAYVTATLGLSLGGTYLCLNGNWPVGLAVTGLGTGMGALFVYSEVHP